MDFLVVACSHTPGLIVVQIISSLYKHFTIVWQSRHSLLCLKDFGSYNPQFSTWWGISMISPGLVHIYSDQCSSISHPSSKLICVALNAIQCSTSGVIDHSARCDTCVSDCSSQFRLSAWIHMDFIAYKECFIHAIKSALWKQSSGMTLTYDNSILCTRLICVHKCYC